APFGIGQLEGIDAEEGRGSIRSGVREALHESLRNRSRGEKLLDRRRMSNAGTAGASRAQECRKFVGIRYDEPVVVVADQVEVVAILRLDLEREAGRA